MKKRSVLSNLVIVAGAVILLYTAISQVYGIIDMRRAEAEFAEQMEELSLEEITPEPEETPTAGPTATMGPTPDAKTPTPIPATPTPKPTPKPRPALKALGTLTIDRMGLVKVPVFEGSGSSQMHVGIGHISTTAKPGAEGNSALAAHRRGAAAKPFAKLNLLKDGDILLFNDGKKDFRYVVFDSFIVNANDTWVLKPLPESPFTLTLISCSYPLFGPTQRIIVQGRLEGT